MAQGINTLRPGTPTSIGGWTENLNGWTLTGAGSIVTALSDNSDASYITSPPFNDGSNPKFVQIPIPGPSPTATQSIDYALIRVRISDLGGGTNQALPLQVRMCSTKYNVNSGVYSLVAMTSDNWSDAGLGAPITMTGVQKTKTPENQVWNAPFYSTASGGVTTYHYNTLDVVQLGTVWYATKQYRVYELYVDYFYNDDPTTPVAGTTYNLARPRPTTPWTITDTENDKILLEATYYYTAAQYGAPGFVPGQTTAASYSVVLPNGTTGLALTSYNSTPVTDLVNNTTYKGYSKVTQAPQARNTAYGASAAFTVVFETPVTPTLTATADSANGRVTLNARAYDNLLTYDESSFETSTTGYTAANCALARGSYTQQGVWAMTLTSSAAGTMSATTATGLSGKPATAGLQYTAMVWVRRVGATTSRNCHIDILWYDSAGTYLSTSTGTIVSGIVGIFTKLSCAAFAPTNTAFAAVSIVVDATGAAGEVYAADMVHFAPGVNTIDWSPGGMTASAGFVGPNAGTGQTILIERSSDGGTTWVPIRPVPVSTTTTGIPSSGIAVGSQVAQTAYDQEAPLGASLTYRATTVTTLAVGDAANPSTASATTLSSIPSTVTSPVTLTAAPGGQGFWLKNCQMGNYLALDAVDDTFALTFPIQEAVYNPLGRPDPVMVLDVANTVESQTVTFEFLTDADWFSFRDNFFKSLRTCLLQKYDGQQWYLQFLSGGTLDEFKGPPPVYRQFKCKWVEVIKP